MKTGRFLAQPAPARGIRYSKYSNSRTIKINENVTFLYWTYVIQQRKNYFPGWILPTCKENLNICLELSCEMLE